MAITLESLTVKCAWHLKNFGEELTMRKGTNPEPVSHGICKDCLRIALCSGCAGDYENPDETAQPTAEDLDAIAEEERIRNATRVTGEGGECYAI